MPFLKVNLILCLPNISTVSISFSITALNDGRPFSWRSLKENITSSAVRGVLSENFASGLILNITHDRSFGYSILLATSP